ncbi:hypothetical protein SAMN05421664_0583 [Chryseobacterium soldanellicola]|uniref:C1q domain-containing protein n=1 Tax=Chryseobacterium soldanellicola TaxID=311333 RepID=A0A1H0YAD4_9FLAO|nr:hypothetical protein [Chryseobacterium soldanellicola]SDQ11846.1 hypothetical protein SAMN05421664_0583 [Chryseobacterium soldanellicola]
MKIKISIFLILHFSTLMLYSQVGIYTNNPQGAFHIDAGKDNSATGQPTAAQQHNDVIFTSPGRLGIGNTNPTAKLEVTSGTTNVSGIQFTNLNAATPISVGQAIGVDADGNIITVSNPSPSTISPFEVESTDSTPFNVNDLGWTVVPGTSQTVPIPVGGKALFINFMIGIDYYVAPASNSKAYYTTRLFIDGVQSTVYQTTEEYVAGAQAQFNLSTVKFLTAGNHTIDVRMRRTFNSTITSGANQPCAPISMCFNASYIN